MTKKEFFKVKTAIKLKHECKVAVMKEDFARELSKLTDETERINLTMAHRADIAAANAGYQQELLDLIVRELRENAEREAKEQEAVTVWPDGSFSSAAVTVIRVINKVRPQHGESLRLSFHYEDGEGWCVSCCHIGGRDPHTLYLDKNSPIEKMEEETRKFVAYVNGDNGEPLAEHFSPSATGLTAFDNALNAIFGERKGGNNE